MTSTTAVAKEKKLSCTYKLISIILHCNCPVDFFLYDDGGSWCSETTTSMICISDTWTQFFYDLWFLALWLVKCVFFDGLGRRCSIMSNASPEVLPRLWDWTHRYLSARWVSYLLTRWQFSTPIQSRPISRLAKYIIMSRSPEWSDFSLVTHDLGLTSALHHSQCDDERWRSGSTFTSNQLVKGHTVLFYVHWVSTEIWSRDNIPEEQATFGIICTYTLSLFLHSIICRKSGREEVVLSSFLGAYCTWMEQRNLWMHCMHVFRSTILFSAFYWIANSMVLFIKEDHQRF